MSAGGEVTDDEEVEEGLLLCLLLLKKELFLPEKIPVPLAFLEVFCGILGQGGRHARMPRREFRCPGVGAVAVVGKG